MSLIKDAIEIGGHYVGTLMVKSANKCVTNKGVPYYTIMLQDISGVIEGRKWEVAFDDDDVLVPGKVIYVEGEILIYNGKPQMKIISVASIPQTNINLREYFISCPMSDEELEKTIYSYIDEIEDEDLKKLVLKVINDNKEKYLTYPAAASYHHSYRGGIAYHSLSVLKLALLMSDQYTIINKDFIIAGALLHDIGKTVELSGLVGTSYTPEGKLMGHITIGANLVNQCASELKTPETIKLQLVHIILAHHDKPEFGSPVPPQTVEALIIHFSDDIDAKMDVLQTALKDVEKGQFSLRIPALDNRIFYKTKE